MALAKSAGERIVSMSRLFEGRAVSSCVLSGAVNTLPDRVHV